MPGAWKTSLIVVVLAAWFSIAGFVGYDRCELDDDLGEYVNNPVRVLCGEKPYRDFWLLHPPGEVYLPAAVYRLGFNVNAVLLVNAGISVLVGLVAFLVGRSVSGSDLEGLLAALLVFFAGVPAEYVGYVYLHVYLLFLLGTAGLLAAYFRTRRLLSLFFAGMLVGCAFFFRTYLTGAAALALLATVLLESRSRNCTWRESAGVLAICGS